MRMRRTKDKKDAKGVVIPGVVVQDCDVYVGRKLFMGGWKLKQSKWHNPFKVEEKEVRFGSEDGRDFSTQPPLFFFFGLLAAAVASASEHSSAQAVAPSTAARALFDKATNEPWTQSRGRSWSGRNPSCAPPRRRGRCEERRRRPPGERRPRRGRRRGLRLRPGPPPRTGASTRRRRR